MFLFESKKTIKQNNSSVDYIMTLSAIGFTSAYYQIPVIDLYSGEAEFSDPGIFPSYIRMSPPYFQQASVWIDMIRKCEWQVVNFMHTSDIQGRMFAARFQYMADHFEIKVSPILKGHQHRSSIIVITTRSPILSNMCQGRAKTLIGPLFNSFSSRLLKLTFFKQSNCLNKKKI